MSLRSSSLSIMLGAIFAATVAGPLGAQQNPTKPYVASVYDSNGKFVGPLIGDSLVLYKLNNVYLAIRITVNGFDTRNFGSAQSYYTTANCTGQQYSIILNGGIPMPTTVFNGRLFFPNMPVAQMTFRSVEGSGKCSPLSQPFVSFAGPLNSRSFDVLGSYTPPFYLN